jgi:hypothetical protein
VATRHFSALKSFSSLLVFRSNYYAVIGSIHSKNVTNPISMAFCICFWSVLLWLHDGNKARPSAKF